jgi:hypothetical protein
MMDDGFDEKAKERKKQKLKMLMLAEKRLLKETQNLLSYVYRWDASTDMHIN